VFVPVAATTPVASESAAGASPRARKPRRFSPAPYLYVLPALGLLVIWTYLPLGQTVGLSFQDWNLIPTSDREFVGLDNYATVLNLPELRQALGNTVWYILGGAVFSLVLPVLIALLSKGVSGKAKTVYQAIIFVPYLVTPVASSAVWRWLFDENGGAITGVLAGMGIDVGNVFRNPSVVLVVIVVIVGWQLLGFGVLVVSAGIAGINPDYGHAASLDGASSAQITRRITLPLLSPSLVFLGLMTILLSAQWTYPVIDVLTQGGPSGASTNIYYLLYEFGFRNFSAGLSSAAGVIFFVVFGIIAAIFVELSERLSFYDN
jgi:multiple sugar transport system permease protein